MAAHAGGGVIPLWLVAAAKGARGFLRAVPWQVWLAAAVLIAGWRYGEWCADTREAAVNARWEQAQREANEQQRAHEQQRDSTADTIADTSDKRAAEAVADTRTTTAQAAERVRYEIRTVEVPAVCDGDVPVVVRDEFSAAISRANAAASALRKGRDP